MYSPKSTIHWFGHDSFLIQGNGLSIYIDPWQISAQEQADIILITHEHFDHCSPEDVQKLTNPNTTIIATQASAKKLKNKDVKLVKPGELITVKDISIETVPAYNTNKFRSPGNPFHPKEAGHVGYIITIEEERIYHSGDCDVIPEMATISADIALLPVSGTYVMTVEEAIEAVSIIKPKLAIPMHVGKGIGDLNDAKKFKEMSPVPVLILPIES